ncbi:MAG: glycosyltransferase family 39 protein [Patescibacteria group bacterium]
MINKLLSEWKGIVIFAPVLLFVAAAIRLINLTILPVFADEAIYIRWSQVMANEPTLRFLPLSDGKQPLFMWILMFLVERFSDPLFIGRLVSVFAGVATIVGIFCLTFYLFKNKYISLLASVFWMFSPYAFFFDRMALVDSLLASFGIWTAFFAVVTAKTKRLDMALLTGFALGFASLTKSPAIFFALLVPTSWLLAEWRLNRKDFVVQGGKLVALIVVTYTLALGMYNIQRLGPNFHMLTSRTYDYVFPVSHAWTNPKDPLFAHFDRAIEWLRLMGPWPILVLAAIGFVVNFKKYWKQVVFLFAWWFVPTIIQAELAKVFTARYELFTIPFIFVLAASAFLTKNKLFKQACSVFFILWFILSVRFDYLLLTDPHKAPLPRSERSGYLEEWTSGIGIKEVADYIKNEHSKNPNEKIVIGTEGYFGTLPDGLQIYLQNVPNVTVIGVGLGFGEVPKPLLDSVKTGTKTYFVANSSRINDKFESSLELNGLKIIKTFKKGDRPLEGYKETVQFGPYDTFYFLEVLPTSN